MPINPNEIASPAISLIPPVYTTGNPLALMEGQPSHSQLIECHAANAILSAIGYNFRLVLAWLVSIRRVPRAIDF
jgi:hypothetical protein